METRARTERRPGLPLGRPLGVPVFLAPSWVFAGALVTWALAPEFAGSVDARPRHYAAAALTAVLFAASVLAHELGHAAIALRLGIPVRRVTLYLFGGLAEMEREPATPATEYLVAVSGPLVSVFLAGCAAVASTALAGDAATVAGFLAGTNAVIAVLNLLPGLPLDGGRVLRSIVWRLTGSYDTGTRAGVRGGQTLALLIGGFGLVHIGAGDQLGLVQVMIGGFIWVNATALGRRASVLARLGRLDMLALVRPALRVPASLPLSEALRRAFDSGDRLLVVDSYGEPSGVISGSALEAVPDQRRPWVTVADVSRALEPGLILREGLDGQRLIERMRATPASEYLVKRADGTIAGILSAYDVARALEGRGGAPA